ncbi:MAG: rhomboid family intramembrane serine protease [Parachlamydiaceae bacterium]|nr:rhomboid family intramembrane serine protease [Parachlamydiaceae bacterium]
MMDNLSWGPTYTPTVIKRLLVVMATLSLLSALTNNLFVHVFSLPGLQEWLSLSWNGLRHYYLWQPITYLFLQPIDSYGIQLSYLISLCFNLYILWVVGTMVHERIGTKHFLALFFLSGLLAGFVALMSMRLVETYIPLAGPTASLLALFVVWAMFYPSNDLLLFFLFPVSPKFLLGVVCGVLAIICIASLDLVSFAFYATGILFGYFYGLLLLGLASPYEFTKPFDRKVLGVINRWRGQEENDTKIVDISTGESPEDEDAFVDAMLTKISRFGERSLTPFERQKMQQISEKRMRDHR